MYTLLQGDELASAKRDYREGFRVVFIIMASFAGFAWVVTFFLMGHSTLTRGDDEKLKREAIERLQKSGEKAGENGKNGKSNALAV